MPKATKYKMFNCTHFVRGLPKEHVASNGNTQKTVYAACRTWQEFADLIGSTIHQVRTYGSQCAGEAATSFCMANPGKPFYVPEWTKSGFVKDFLPLPPLPEWAVRDIADRKAREQARKKNPNHELVTMTCPCCGRKVVLPGVCCGMKFGTM